MRRLFPFLLMLALLVVASCDYSIVEQPPASPGPAGISISVTPIVKTLAPGDSARFRAIVTGTADTSVTWSIVSGLGSIDATGMFTASAETGTTKIRARANADTTKTASATITVTTGGGPQIIVSVMPETAQIHPKGTQQLTATVSGADDQSVVWSVIGPGTVSASGLYTAPSTITENPTMVMVQAASVVDPTATGIATIEVMVPDDPNRICFRDIKEIIVSNCAMSGCHDPISRKEGYDFTTTRGILRGVRPFRSGSSSIYESITTRDAGDRMPQDRAPLPQSTIDLIRRWIDNGADTSACPPPYGTCDTTAVTYSATVRPILAQSCVGCHTGADYSNKHVDLSTYDGVRSAATSGQLVGSITWTDPFIHMPYGADAKIDACAIAKIKAWVTRGAPNN